MPLKAANAIIHPEMHNNFIKKIFEIMTHSKMKEMSLPEQQLGVVILSVGCGVSEVVQELYRMVVTDISQS